MGETSPEYLAGLIVGIKEHLDRQDRTHEADKQAAIAARAANHEENKGAINELRESIDGTAVMARASNDWIDAYGKPLVTRVDNIHERVTAIEDEKKADAAESRGSFKTWAFIGTVCTAIGGAFGALLTYRDQLLDILRGH